MKKKPVIAVIDGMGGNIGHQIISQLRRDLPQDLEILAFGTNSAATANMMRARASRGATGDNAIRVSIAVADVVLAPIAVVIPNSYLGELTPSIAAAIASAPAEKILLPLGQAGYHLVGTTGDPLPHLMDQALAKLRELFKIDKEVNADV